MSDCLAMRPAPRAATASLAAGLVRNGLRWLLLAIGGALVVVGVLMAPLPGPLGLPVTLVGLMIVLRNSFRARRAFVRFQHRHPRILFPLRKLMRRDPQVVSFAWQQTLRVERLVLPPEWRQAARFRRRFFRRARKG